MFLCDWKKPIYHLSNENNFCDLDHDTEKCKVHRSKCENRWTPLSNPSLFLYHCCNVYSVKIICGEEINKITLSNAGVFYLGPGCLLKGQDFTLNIQSPKKNIIGMSPNIFIPEMDQLNLIINSSLPLKYYEDVTDSGEMKDALETLHKRIVDLNKSRVEVGDTLSSHDIHQYAVCYVVVVALALAAGALLCRWLRRRARRAHITSGMELQPTTSVSDVNTNSASVSARQNMVERQPSVTRRIMNRECPHVPTNRLGTISA
ncbi:hypothetical protein PYW08_006993 [Mythimna loreyi]|uniref:Uncharacterized protein n=1 Tax=Mythimna loreyi TaxID=667449 RepID=A0ACC2RBN7_9NEOP|nr:hypothetical protein PYW08_006993 [Mythimna loreyi]